MNTLATSKLRQETDMLIGNMTVVCQDSHRIPNTIFWFHGSPLNSAAGLLLMQLSAISIVSQLFNLLLRPLGQSSIVSQIFSGMVFGPSLLGHKWSMPKKLFPARGAMMMETIATSGLMFFLFAISVKMDPASMVRPGRKAMTIGLSVFFFTFLFSMSIAFILTRYVALETNLKDSLFFIAGSQTLTGFPVIACLLTELKMLNTNVGRLALSSSMLCDVLGISSTAVTISILGNNSGSALTPVWSILSAVALVAGIFCIIRPAILWALKRAPNANLIDETFISTMFVVVLMVGFLSETIGQHYIFGPLVLGFVVPDGSPLGIALTSKIEALASGMFYPTYLAISGLRTNFFKVRSQGSWVVSIVVLFSCIVKIGAVMIPAAVYGDTPAREAFVLGLIMNAKGIVELMVFNLWRDAKVLSDEEFTLSVLSVIAVTAIITPLIKVLYIDPSSQYIAIKRSTIQHSRHEGDLRILVGIHSHENVPTVINLLEASHASQESNIAVTAIVLVELVGRTTPILVSHKPQYTQETTTSPRGHIINALSKYENRKGGWVTVQSFTSISPYVTMYNDICRLAVDKRANIVILPFHKQWDIDGTIGSVNRAIQNMNVNVLETAPCSVGILIDRGILTGSISLQTGRPLYHAAVIYIGGADDAESLAYGARMAQNRSVDLTVVWFILFGTENTKDRKREAELINEYRKANVGNERFVIVEEMVKDGTGLASCINEMVDCFDLILVGRQHQQSPLLAAFGQWCECPELGVIGDMLASPDIASTASVLVVQQQRMGGNSMQHATGDRDQLVHDVPYDEQARGSWSIAVDKS